MHDLFLSYARDDDEPFVHKLYDHLTAAGFDVWFDRQRMPQEGRTFGENIKRAVLNSRRLALIVGPAALRSNYVRKEWRTAAECRECIPVIPLLRVPLHPHDPDHDFGALPADLPRIDAIDFRQDDAFEAKLDYLMRQLRAEVPPPGEVHGLHHFQLPRGYILRNDLWKALDNAVRGDAISAQVATSREQITALQGMAGLGKTVMAAAYVQDCTVRRTFDHGIYWLTAGRDAEVFALQVQVARALGVATDDYTPANSAEKLRLSLLDRRALLVLDDVWDKAIIEGFRPTLGQECRLLFTTRNARLVTLTQAQRIRVETLDTEDGVRLIGRWLDREDGGANPEAERAIVETLKGHTLAVTLAAARIDEEGPAFAPTLLAHYQTAQESANPFEDLELADDDKNWSVELSLRLSYEALDAKGRRRFRALGVLAENVSFKRDLAAALWEVDDASGGLGALANAALVDAEPDGRYAQHSVLRAYASALLRREDQHRALLLRYADTVIAWAAEFDRLPPEQWAHLDAEAGHFVAVGDALVAGYEQDDALRERGRDFAYAVTHYLEMRREVRRVGWLEMGLSIASDQHDEARQALFLNEIGLAWSFQGENRRALESYEQALRLFLAANDHGSAASILSNIGRAWDILGHHHKALQHYEEALALFGTIGDRDGAAISYNNMARVWSVLGRKREALQSFEQALLLFRNTGNRGYEATALNNIGTIWDDLGEQHQALQYYQQALSLYSAVGNRQGEAAALNNIGRIYDELGDQHKALAFYEQALSRFQETGDRNGEASTLGNIGCVWEDLGDQHKALAFYEQALTLHRAAEDQSGQALALNNIGGAWSALNEKYKALEYYEQALMLCQSGVDPRGEAITLNNIGTTWAALGNWQRALDYYVRSLPLRHAVGDPVGEAATLDSVANIYFDQDDLPRAAEALQRLVTVIESIGDVAREAMYRFNLAGVYYRLEDTAASMTQLEQSIALLQSTNLLQDAAGQTLAQHKSLLAYLRGETQT